MVANELSIPNDIIATMIKNIKTDRYVHHSDGVLKQLEDDSDSEESDTIEDGKSYYIEFQDLRWVDLSSYYIQS